MNTVKAIATLASQPATTISDIEIKVQRGLEALRGAPLNAQITEALNYLVPAGYRPFVQLEEDGRKKRSTAAASNWNPETGEIVIYFERVVTVPAVDTTASMQTLRVESVELSHDFPRPTRVRDAASPALPAIEPQQISSLQIQQCCEALAEAEKAGKSFIALKWFRDNALTERGYGWADSLSERQAVLAKAIEAGALLTSTIPNPKAPQHPTTTVKLNRESKYAQSIAPRFQPIRAKGGASASEILLHDRGRP